MCVVLLAYFYYNTRTWGNSMSYAEFREKMMLVDNVLAGRVFETNINKLPVLAELFKEYENAQKYFIPGLNMTDYDESCNGLYEDSVSGDFDKDWYSWKEYEFKMIHLNKTETKVWNCDRRSGVEPYGCCTACEDVENCCACQNDGKRDIMKEVLEPNKDVPFALNSPITRGFGFEQTSERYQMQELYQTALRKLGYGGSQKAVENYAHCKAFTYIPPGGFFLWHTNRYDNSVVPYRMYIISVDRDGESAFKYQLPNGENHEVMDFHGAVRIFKNTFDDPKTGEEKYLWHSVYSNCHRNSLGFEIRPIELIAMLDECGSCWDDVKQSYLEIYGTPYAGLNGS
jgi:hypothetical protein